MGNGNSRRAVDTSNVDFSVRISDLRIINFNNYSTFDSGFQQRFHLQVWSEFRQTVEQAVTSYTSDTNLTSWSGTYKCLSIIPFILAIISGISCIYSFYALTFGLVFGATSVWVSAVVLICLLFVWGIIVFIIRQKLLGFKTAYHAEIEQRVQSAIQQLNNRYNGQCQFLLERIAGNRSVDFDFSCNLRMFFKIILFTQQVLQPQYGAIGGAQQAQPQAVMVQMPNGQMVMAQVVGQPQQQVAYQQPIAQQPQQQQIVYQQPQQQVVYQSPSAPSVPSQQQYVTPQLAQGGEGGGNNQVNHGEGGHTMQ